jgi:hypothetical protein
MTTRPAIETSAGLFFAVREPEDAALAHGWIGLPVKRTKDGFAPKANAREILVRMRDRIAIDDRPISFVAMPEELRSHDEIVWWMTKEMPKALVQSRQTNAQRRST